MPANNWSDQRLHGKNIPHPSLAMAWDEVDSWPDNPYTGWVHGADECRSPFAERAYYPKDRRAPGRLAIVLLPPAHHARLQVHP